ncbi:polysaccharide pyruvyl transferase CsaB [Bacillus horti]|uniref:Polysaccharide pyruvyl transferase CsaB n=1 Tax=Caldalkalibacillus horti TaxID=77523 RepID=A0ABT9VTR5_9BACI|nr:polysaccharide pyruvyl transferase CsaB [Bacillus horti]MDQ0164380.1 polysaccharide pyruvyl transferase CsaB [Bacillus horti]
MQTKRIMLSGYYGFNNAGDEAILLSILQSIRSLDEHVEFIVLSGNPAKTAEQYGVHAISRTDVMEIWRCLKNVDLFISGGGSLLQDKTGTFTIPYYLGVVQLAQWAKVPVAIYAQGIGPVYRSLFQKWIKAVFKKAQYISVRDPSSKKLLESWKLPSEKIDQVIDPVFVLQSDESERVTELLSKESITLKQKPIIFAIRHWSEGKDDILQIAKVCDQLVQDGEEVLLLPMHYPDDAEAACDIMANMTQPVHLLQREYTPQQLIDIVSSGKLMVGMRLHALIFAAARHVPCIGISYDPKIDAFMHLLEDQSTSVSGQISADLLYAKIKDDLTHYQQRQEQTASIAKKLLEQAKKPAREALKLIQQGSV